jgi:outer membrane lipoprotein SlyB
MNKALTNVVAIASVVALAGCAATGENLQANVYKAGQVNQTQEAKTVQILAVMPAKIEVDNSAQKKQAEVGGAVAGALLGGLISHFTGGSADAVALSAVGGGAVGGVGGSLVQDKVLVDGVSLTYTLKGKTLNSAQVGRSCEFAPGMAVMISTSPTETRIQPNKECPKEK